MKLATAGLPYKWISIFLVLISTLLGLGAAVKTQAAANDGAWQNYTSSDASYAIDFPPNAQITESDDAALRYNHFPPFL